jgi:hypothetical protein
MVEDEQQDALLIGAKVDTGAHQGSHGEIEWPDGICIDAVFHLLLGEMRSIADGYFDGGVSINTLAGRSINFLEPHLQDRVSRCQHIKRFAQMNGIQFVKNMNAQTYITKTARLRMLLILKP